MLNMNNAAQTKVTNNFQVARTFGSSSYFVVVLIDGNGVRHLGAVTKDVCTQVNPNGKLRVAIYTRRKGDVAGVAEAVIAAHQAKENAYAQTFGGLIKVPAVPQRDAYESVERWNATDWNDWFGDHARTS